MFISLHLPFDVQNSTELVRGWLAMIGDGCAGSGMTSEVTIKTEGKRRDELLEKGHKWIGNNGFICFFSQKLLHLRLKKEIFLNKCNNWIFW